VAQPLLFNQRLGALTNGGVQTIVLITALFGWLQVCLLMGARLKAFREEDFVHAAQTGVKAPANPSSAT
jgi:ABC-type dipeptide/oligopeptide/nickel transport system permease subunit